MAITQTGTTLEFIAQSTANTGPAVDSSTSMTVPADAEIVIAAWGSFKSTVANFFSGGSMTFPKGGVDTAMTAISGGDSNTSFFQGVLFYMVLPDTGASKVIRWDWAGTTTADDAGILSVTFWKGIDTASPVRDSDGAQAASLPYTTPSLTALTGDLIVAWVTTSTTVNGSVDSWSNLSLLSQLSKPASGLMDGAWATGSPTGNTTVAASTGTNYNDGAIVAIVLKPASATFQWYPMDFLSFFAELPIIRPILDIIGY